MDDAFFWGFFCYSAIICDLLVVYLFLEGEKLILRDELLLKVGVLPKSISGADI